MDDGGGYVIIDARNEIIAEAFHRTEENNYHDAKANATLYAAAPELLEALQEIARSTFKDEAKFSAMHRHCVNTAKAAIAKATACPEPVEGESKT